VHEILNHLSRIAEGLGSNALPSVRVVGDA